MGFAKGNPGRPKGSKNKVTQAAREAFAKAFDEIGGGASLAQWATENPTEFYKLYARLIPVENQVTGADGQPLGVVILPAVQG